MEKEKIALVCCSDAQQPSCKNDIENLVAKLTKIGYDVVVSPVMYADGGPFPGSIEERANALMSFYRDNSVSHICDISGGDIANTILPYLDFEIIKNSNKKFWGYSDLTTIVNAIYTKTGNTSYLYQIKNLVWDKTGTQEKNFADNKKIFNFPYTFLRGEKMEGVVVGGNIRCLLKLAGTPFMPDFTDKILLLESLGGKSAQCVTYVAALSQLGIFEKIKGILLGTFTVMEQENCTPSAPDLILESTKKLNIPVAKTQFIGHGNTSKAIEIGKFYSF